MMDPDRGNDAFDPAFHSLTADDFGVVQSGWGQPAPSVPQRGGGSMTK